MIDVMLVLIISRNNRSCLAHGRDRRDLTAFSADGAHRWRSSESQEIIELISVYTGMLRMRTSITINCSNSGNVLGPLSTKHGSVSYQTADARGGYRTKPKSFEIMEGPYGVSYDNVTLCN